MINTKCLILILFVCTFLSYPYNQTMANSSKSTGGQLVRIGLKSLGEHNKFEISSSSGQLEIINSNNEQIYKGSSDSVYVEMGNDKKLILLLQGEEHTEYGELTFKPIGNATNQTETIGIKPSKKSVFRQYKGSISILKHKRALFAINELDIEEYLMSVVPCEMNCNAPMASLESQAIAARSYALANISRHIKEGYNLCDQVHCQVYGDKSKEFDSTTKAVKATYAKVLYYNSCPANTVYHSNCGGVIIDSRAAWGGSKVEYLISHIDGVAGSEAFCKIGRKAKKNLGIKDLPDIQEDLVINTLSWKTKSYKHSYHGHRVGMCQDGAIGMGTIGYTTEQIIAFYYPNTELTTLDYASNNQLQNIQLAAAIEIECPQTPYDFFEDEEIPENEEIPEDEEELKNYDYNEEIAQNPLIIALNPTARKKSGIISILKEISASPKADIVDFRKLFWNTNNPEISRTLF